MELDRIDRRILDEMQCNGRITNQELADKVGLSPSPCLRRVRQLEEAGYIDDHVTLLNPGKLGLKLTALLQINLDRHTPELFSEFEKTVAGYPEVVECILITGQSAYQLKVLIPDMEAYQHFLLKKITVIPGVSDVHSSFVLRQIVNRTTIPIDGE